VQGVVAEGQVEGAVGPGQRRGGVQAGVLGLGRHEAARQPALGEDDVGARGRHPARGELAQEVPDPAGQLEHPLGAARMGVEQREPRQVRRIGPAEGEVVPHGPEAQGAHGVPQRARRHRGAGVLLRRPGSARPVVAVAEQEGQGAVLVARLEPLAGGRGQLLAARAQEGDPGDDEGLAQISRHERSTSMPKACSGPSCTIS
jgi:hypothetical protein